MSGVLLVIAIVFMATAVIAGLAKRWFPKAAVTVGITCFAGMFLSFLVLLAVDAFNGQVQDVGRGNGSVLLADRPSAFWALLALYGVAGVVGLAASFLAIRKHLRGQLWPRAWW
jgi:formate hydrogenlyase subunit 3/multisubunit Na+/H+ antiporter MnhD subunit